VIDFIEQQPLKTYALRRGGGRIRRLHRDPAFDFCRAVRSSC
jgi:hypothetical protein